MTFRRLLLLLVTVGLTACGGGGQGFPSYDRSEGRGGGKPPPPVITDLAVDGALRFDISIDCTVASADSSASIEGQFTVDGGLTWAPMRLTDAAAVAIGSPVTIGWRSLLDVGATTGSHAMIRLRAVGGGGAGAWSPLDLGSVSNPVVRYVDQDATGSGDGSSWADAMTDPLPALAGAGMVWIAEGTYVPGDTRSSTFVLADGLELYGGFRGDETDPAARDVASHPSVLSGEIGAPGPDDNCYHVASGGGAILDGVSICDGSATHPSEYDHKYSGAVFPTGGNLLFRGCTFSRNRAKNTGGVVCQTYALRSAVTFESCRFIENHADWAGGVFAGGFRTSGGGFSDCYFERNTANNEAVLQLSHSDFVIERCTFVDNQADSSAGAISIYPESEVLVVDCRFEGNRAGVIAGALGLHSSSTAGSTILRCAFIDNRAGTYGGAVRVHASYGDRFEACTFIGNGGAWRGGVVNAGDCDLTFSNCLFADNDGEDGGVVYSTGDLAFESCTIVGNSASSRGGFLCQPFDVGRAIVRNCIIAGDGSGDPVVSFGATRDFGVDHCLLEGAGGSGAWDTTFGTDLGGNIDGVVGFIDAAGGDYGLAPTSICVDAGSEDLLPADSADLDGDGDHDESLPLDRMGQDRVLGEGLDMGAQESPAASSG